MKRRLIGLSVCLVLFATFIGFSKPPVAYAACTSMTAGPGTSFTATLAAGQSITVFVTGGASVTVVGPITLTLLTNVTIFGPNTWNVSIGGSGGTATITSNGFNLPCPSTGLVTFTNFTDGRLNSHDPWETSALYCQSDGSLQVLALAQLQPPTWVLAFTVTPAEIAKVPKHPTSHTLIKQKTVSPGMNVALYRLVNGQLQVNSTGLNPADGIYFFRFDDCPIP